MGKLLIGKETAVKALNLAVAVELGSMNPKEEGIDQISYLEHYWGLN